MPAETVLLLEIPPLPPPDQRLIRLIAKHAAKEGGVLAVTERDGRYVAGYQFGREAEDSDMAGGAAYGIGDTVYEALNSLVADLGGLGI